MPPAPRAVVFDLDGLMFNTEELYQEVGDELMGRRGQLFTPELRAATMGRPARVSLQIMIDWYRLTATVPELVAEVDVIFGGLLEARLRPMHGLPELLAHLEAMGVPKAVGTSSGIKYARDILGRFDYEPRFEFVLTAEDVTDGKPHPEIYLKAAKRLGFSPAEVLVLEDSHTGCSAAVAAGTFAVAVPGDHSRHQDFSKASLVIDHLADPRLYDVLAGGQINGYSSPSSRSM